MAAHQKFATGAARTNCHILFNRAWIIRHWYQKPAHFSDAEPYPEWLSHLKRVTPSDPYFVDGKPQQWEPVQWYNTKWKSRTIEHANVCFLLDRGESVALGLFQPDAKGQTKRRASLQKAATGILLDVDEGIPSEIVTCDDLIEAVPFLKYATGVRESVSSRSERKDGRSQFRAYFGLETPLLVDCENNAVAVRTREKLGEWLAAQCVYAPEGLAKNAVCVAYGNAGTLSKYDSDFLISADFIQELMKDAEAEIAAEARKKEADAKQREHRQRVNLTRRDAIDGDARSPIEAFIEDEDPVRYLERQGWMRHLRGDEYHWHASSSAGRSCLIEDGIIKPFSASLQAASPAGDKPVNAHRFIIYYETQLDISNESDKPEIRRNLADRGYGMALETFQQLTKETETPRRIQKPIQLQRREDISFVTEALEESRDFLSNAFEKFSGLVGLRSDTGVGKTEEAIRVYQIKAPRGFFSTPTTDLSKEVFARMYAAEIDAFRWRGIHSEPDGEFPHEKPCIQPDRYVAYLESGRNAYEILCTNCPAFERCLQDGYRGQEAKARKAQVTVAAHKDLLFDPAFRPTAKRLLPKDESDLIIIDEFDVFEAFIEVDLPQGRLEQLAKTWHDHDLGTFAKIVLQACLFEANPFDSLRSLVERLTNDERHRILQALTEYRLGDTILSREEANALETRTGPRTVDEIKRLPLIETDDWNLLLQLELFFERYTDPENAPMQWKDNVLQFAIQPLPLYTAAKVICMSATLDKDLFLSAFAARQEKRGDVSFVDGADTEWHPDAEVFQLRTNRNPRATLLVLEEKDGKWRFTGELTGTGKAYMAQILESFEKMEGSKAFISHKPLVEKYQSELDALGVKTGHFGGLAGLDSHFERDGDAGITLHILGTPEIPEWGLEYRAKLLSAEKGAIHDASVKSELMQAVGRAGLVKNPSTVYLWTSLELPSVTHRDQTELFDDSDWEGRLDGLTERIREREARDATVDQAETDGDVEALIDEGISESTAYRKTEQARKQTKAERDAEICRRYAAGETQKEIAETLDIGLATVNRVLNREPF